MQPDSYQQSLISYCQRICERLSFKKVEATHQFI